MTAMIARPIAVLAALGWVATIALSVASPAGAQLSSLFQDALFVALFPLSLGALVLLACAVNGRILTPRLWMSWAFDRVPAWLRIMAYVSLLYCFVLFIARLFGVALPESGAMASLLGMFYGFALVMLWAASDI